MSGFLLVFDLGLGSGASDRGGGPKAARTEKSLAAAATATPASVADEASKQEQQHQRTPLHQPVPLPTLLHDSSFEDSRMHRQGVAEKAAASLSASGHGLAAAVVVGKSNPASKHKGVAVASLLSKAEHAMELAAGGQLMLTGDAEDAVQKHLPLMIKAARPARHGGRGGR